MVEQIYSADRLLAIIIPHDFTTPGVNFITPHNLSQQLALIAEGGTYPVTSGWPGDVSIFQTAWH